MVPLPNVDMMDIVLYADGPYQGACVVAFNRPERANSLTPAVYREWRDVLNWAANDERIRLVVLTGRGRFYCSGQELDIAGLFMEEEDGRTLEERIRADVDVTNDLVHVLIDFPKPIVAAVNGPAMGFGVTTLALCDFVYASDQATFMTPFMRLGFCAEGCSSYTFPRMMGLSNANEFLLLNKTFSAHEAVRVNLVSAVIPASDSQDFVSKVLARIQPLLSYPPTAILQTKRLVFSDDERNHLKRVNASELDLLVRRFMDPECHEAIMTFMGASFARFVLISGLDERRASKLSKL